MASARRTTPASAPPSAAPTKELIALSTPQPATITAPDAPQFLQKYQAQVAPMTAFQVVDNESDIICQQAFSRVGDFIAEIEAAFKPAKSAAHKAHKEITALESMFTGPAQLVKDNLSSQHLAWVRRCDEIRRAEERRLQEAQEAQARAEAEERRRQLQAEEDARVAAELQRLAELPPWEQPEEEPVAVVVAPVPVAEVPVVRLPSTVPVAVGGPSTRFKPWAGRVTDFRILVEFLAKRLEEGDDRWLDVITIDAVRLNQLAKDHTTALCEILPGTEAFREETLKRG